MSWRVIEVPTIIMGGEQIANGSKHDDGIGFSFRIANFVSSQCCTRPLLVPFSISYLRKIDSHSQEGSAMLHPYSCPPRYLQHALALKGAYETDNIIIWIHPLISWTQGTPNRDPAINAYHH